MRSDKPKRFTWCAAKFLPLIYLFWLLPGLVLADGKVIPQTAFAVPEIPDQQALIHYANGVETLVIETSFVGPGTNFAWVVPLPAAGKITPVAAGLFPTLRSVFQPEVVLSVKPYWLALPVAMLLVWLVRLARRGSVIVVILFGFALLLVLGFFLPAVAPAKSRAMAADSLATSVQVLNRQQAGLFDTVTIQSSEPTALWRWLNENGFGTPTNLAPVVADYVKEGWVFAAARLNCPTGEASSHATHPLAFSFPAPKPVYPLRLTGTGNTPCRIDLYVFGPGRAEVPDFTVERCARPQYGGGVNWTMKPGGLRVRHTELEKLAAQAPVATKLTAVLSPEKMNRDGVVAWGLSGTSGGKRYSKGAAATLAGNVAALAFMAGVVLWWILGQARPGLRAGLEDFRKWVAPVALAAGSAVFLSALPFVESSGLRTVRGGWSRIRNDTFMLALAFQDEMGNPEAISSAAASPQTLTPAEEEGLLRAVIQDYQKEWSADAQWYSPLTNFFTGELIRFEASPGNIILRPAKRAGYELVWHDLDGAEAITNAVAR